MKRRFVLSSSIYQRSMLFSWLDELHEAPIEVQVQVMFDEKSHTQVYSNIQWMEILCSITTLLYSQGTAIKPRKLMDTSKLYPNEGRE